MEVSFGFGVVCRLMYIVYRCLLLVFLLWVGVGIM